MKIKTIPAINKRLPCCSQRKDKREIDGDLGTAAESRFQQTLRIIRLFRNIFFLITQPGTAGA
jgi:hypothetical protein